MKRDSRNLSRHSSCKLFTISQITEQTRENMACLTNSYSSPLTHPVDLRLRCLHERLQHDLEVLLEVGTDGQSHVTEHREDLRLDLPVHVLVREVLEQDRHDLVAVRQYAGGHRSADVANEANGSVADPRNTKKRILMFVESNGTK